MLETNKYQDKYFNVVLTIIIVVVVAGVLTAGYYIGKIANKTDLEIYTKSDIIYIRGLSVSFESKEDTYVFRDRESLKVFISTVTVESLGIK